MIKQSAAQRKEEVPRYRIAEWLKWETGCDTLLAGSLDLTKSSIFPCITNTHSPIRKICWFCCHKYRQEVVRLTGSLPRVALLGHSPMVLWKSSRQICCCVLFDSSTGADRPSSLRGLKQACSSLKGLLFKALFRPK